MPVQKSLEDAHPAHVTRLFVRLLFCHERSQLCGHREILTNLDSLHNPLGCGVSARCTPAMCSEVLR